MKTVIEMAREAGIEQVDQDVEEWICFTDELERFAELVRTDERARMAEQPAQQEPVALKWQQSPIRTAWGDDMVVASVAIDNDHTLSLYCERDQTPKVEAMFAQRTWVELTDREIDELWMSQHDDFGNPLSATGYERAIEAKLKEKNT